MNPLNIGPDAVNDELLIELGRGYEEMREAGLDRKLVHRLHADRRVGDLAQGVRDFLAVMASGEEDPERVRPWVYARLLLRHLLNGALWWGVGVLLLFVVTRNPGYLVSGSLLFLIAGPLMVLLNQLAGFTFWYLACARPAYEERRYLERGLEIAGFAFPLIAEDLVASLEGLDCYRLDAEAALEGCRAGRTLN